MFIQKKISKLVIYLLCLFLMIESFPSYGQPSLTLQDYLNEVNCNHFGLQGAKFNKRGGQKRAYEGLMLFKPSLFAEGQYLKDMYDPSWSPINGNTSKLQAYKLGLSETTPFGLQGKVYYNYQHQTLSGLFPSFNTQSQIVASTPIIEFSLPLGRNLAGRETRAAAQLLNSQARLQKYSESYKIKLILAQAESAYWRLALTRSIVALQNESLHRAQKIYEWVSKRTSFRLAENSDLLQARAAIAGKQLDVRSALNDEKLAERNFNTLRGNPCTYVPECLCSYRNNLIFKLKIPPKIGPREDVKAAEQEANIAIAQAKLGIEKNKPSLELYASYALNGRNPSSNEAVAQSFTSNYPSTAVGLRLSMPLDLGHLARIRSGYKDQIRGAQFQYQERLFEDQRLWEELVERLDNAKNKLEIAMQLENIQLKKLQVERERLTLGKTTTYQMLMFEQDYANAQLALYVIQDEILGLIAQLKTFGAC